MVWQDIVIGLAQILFIPAMIPTLLGTDKPAFVTSAFNSMLVGIITFCLFSLELWFASATAAPICIIWAILAIQKRNQVKFKR